MTACYVGELAVYIYSIYISQQFSAASAGDLYSEYILLDMLVGGVPYYWLIILLNSQI